MFFWKTQNKSIEPKTSIAFSVNNFPFQLSTFDVNSTLNEWLRENGFSGAKKMCAEGGCGSCVVAVYPPQSSTPVPTNSCLMPLYAADGCNIVTSDGIGSIKGGFNEVQKRITEHGGTQCGYCTPGFVMSIYSKVNSGEQFTQQDMEDNLDGHICRCTGYRSLLDAAKSFASGDIEDLCDLPCVKQKKTGELSIKANRQKRNSGTEMTKLYRPARLDQLKTLMSDPTIFTDSSCFSCSKTSKGIFKTTGQPEPRVTIDVSNVVEMRSDKVEGGVLTVGAAVSINRLAGLLVGASGGEIFTTAHRHLKKVAGNTIRNVASWAGNVMVKHEHKYFPSDVCVVLAGLRATFNVYDGDSGKNERCGLFGEGGLMECDMRKKVVVSMEIAVPTSEVEATTVFRTFKIMPRSQNSHAYVNASFRAGVNADRSKFSDQVCIVYGNISEKFNRAFATEKVLAGSPIDQSTFKTALSTLNDELCPVQRNEVDVSVENKKDIALSLFYKFFLSCMPEGSVDAKLKSAMREIERPLSTGTQTFTTNKGTYPVSQPIPKISSNVQASGQAYYISDQPATTNELFCAFVLSEVGNCDIDVIDSTFASLQPGFNAIITGASFPSSVKNSRFGEFDASQLLLATDHIDYAGQPLALVLAESQKQASSIAAQVVVTYKNLKTNILTTRQAIQAGSYFDLNLDDIVVGTPDESLKNCQNQVSGSIDLGGQYHFYMETQVTRVEGTEEGGFVVESASQVHMWLQQCLSYVYGVPANKIEVKTKRIGGAYGGKATNSLVIALATALGTYVTGRPCRFHADLKTCMATLGSRLPYSLDYKLGFDDSGVLEVFDWSIYTNSGCSQFDNELDDPSAISIFADSAYHCPNWRIRRKVCKTNLPSGTWCRAPGSMQLTAFTDTMLEIVADHLSMNVTDVKFNNLYLKNQTAMDGQVLKDCHIRDMFTSLMNKSNYERRQKEADEFNSSNTYKKRALAVTPIKFTLGYAKMLKYNVLLTISCLDGSICVSQGGIEVGQGLDTKVAQVVAYGLGCDLSDVSVKRTSTLSSSNSQVTGGSSTSELVCRSAAKCCEIMAERMKGTKSELPVGTSWKDLVAACYNDGVDLIVSCNHPPDFDGDAYNVWGVTSSEVELDVLTGEHLIRRVDLIEDAGISLNPTIDLGQIEGAFVMALGFWLSEHMVYDVTTGKLLTDGTWEYKPPTTKDIPVEWNIELYRNESNPVGVYNSKATGEPPLCMGVSCYHALRRAVDASLEERKKKGGGWTYLQQPLTPDSLKNSLKVDPIQDFVV